MDYKTLIVTHIVSYLFDDAATQQAKLLKAWDVCKKLFKQKRDELPLAYGILCILYDRFMTPQGYSAYEADSPIFVTMTHKAGTQVCPLISESRRRFLICLTMD
jgi:hypothetical protein